MGINKIIGIPEGEENKNLKSKWLVRDLEFLGTLYFYIIQPSTNSLSSLMIWFTVYAFMVSCSTAINFLFLAKTLIIFFCLDHLYIQLYKKQLLSSFMRGLWLS